MSVFASYLVGDIGKVQWPAGLQKLDFLDLTALFRWNGNPFGPGTMNITGKRHWRSFVCSANIFEHFSCGPSRKPDLHPAFFRRLFLLVLCPFERFQGDISAVKWPEGLQKVWLEGTKVAGTSLVHFCRFYAPGELSSRAAPAAKMTSIPRFSDLFFCSFWDCLNAFQGIFQQPSGRRDFRRWISATPRFQVRRRCNFVDFMRPENFLCVRPQPQNFLIPRFLECLVLPRR